MAENLISTNVSPKQITFKPGGNVTSFEVTVNNDSDRFASFQLEVLAAGTDSNPKADWYSISPEVSTKNPPGDTTQFQVAIIDTPMPGFVGTMDLEVRVFSIELGNEDRARLRLNLEQGTGFPLKLELPIQKFQAYPNSQIEIPVLVYNPGQRSTNVVIRCLGLEPTWFIEGIEQRLNLSPNRQATVTFLCQIPTATLAPSKIYPVTIEASHQYGLPTTMEATLEVMPTGEVKFQCNPTLHYLPEKQGWWPKRDTEPVTYLLELENASNLSQQVTVQVDSKKAQKVTLELIPEQIDIIPGETHRQQLVVNSKRPWLGITQKLQLTATPVLSNQKLGNTEPVNETLELHILPIIHAWLQIGGGLLLLFLLFLVWMLLPKGHEAPVRTVSFNGLGDWVVSGSDDQTIRQWHIQGNSLQPVGVLGKTTKAVRVVRYKPVDNNLLAVGLENGEIKLWDLLSGQQKDLISEKDDRVFDLEFSKDSRYLFSGHGNDVVLQWDLQASTSKFSPTTNQPRRQKVSFTVSDMALVGKEYKHLAIGGRFNRLVLWNWSDDKTNKLPLPVPYPIPGGQENYISSLAIANDKPNLMAVADNQGYITLWDLNECLINENLPCQKLDEWRGGLSGEAVRSVSLSANGCYLVSAGDDKRLVLWPLSIDGRRAAKFLDGEVLERYAKKLNSVDLKLVGKEDILIITGGDDNQVRLRHTTRLPQLGCDTPKPVIP